MQTFLAFKVGTEHFAIPVRNVLVVLRKNGITAVPKTADYIVGILQFRGDVISVVSAKIKLNVPDGKDAKKQVVIVIEFENSGKFSKLGILANMVIGVVNIPENDIKPVMEFGNYYNPEFLKGVFKHKKDIITILDISKIFSEDEISIINNVNIKNK
jgi:purine-binding chemotaxis protein CheW